MSFSIKNTKYFTKISQNPWQTFCNDTFHIAEVQDTTGQWPEQNENVPNIYDIKNEIYH